MKSTFFCYNNYSLPISKQFLNFPVDEMIISTFFFTFLCRQGKERVGVRRGGWDLGTERGAETKGLNGLNTDSSLEID